MSMLLLANHHTYRPTVLEAGRHRSRRTRPHHYGQPIQSARYRLIRVIDGYITWRVGEQSYTIPPDGLSLIGPQASTHALVVSPACRWSDIRFSAMPARGVDPGVGALWGVELPAVVELHAEDDGHVRMQATFDDIVASWWRSPWMRLQADARLASFLLQLLESYGRRRVTENHQVSDHRLPADRFTRADSIWHNRPRASISEVAAACGYSERQFRRLFTAQRGLSPHVWARRIMVDRARELLREQPEWTIDEIARHLGYRHTPTFIRMFAESVGMTPARWRRSA